MPIPNYSVLRGRPVSGKVVQGQSAHDLISVMTPAGAFTAALNIQSVDGSEVLYAIVQAFTPPDPGALLALPQGITPLQSKPGGLALDFVRETVSGRPMITRAEMQLLPTARANAIQARALESAVIALINQAAANPQAQIFAFGSSFADKGVTDGVHNLHMNQGNPPANHKSENGTWQDGAIFLNLPAQGSSDPQWTAVFIAFQTQSWTTDVSGNPAA